MEFLLKYLPFTLTLLVFFLLTGYLIGRIFNRKGKLVGLILGVIFFLAMLFAAGLSHFDAGASSSESMKELVISLFYGILVFASIIFGAKLGIFVKRISKNRSFFK